MRRLGFALLVVLLVGLLPCEVFAEPRYFGPEQDALLDIRDEYDTTNQVDIPATSAEVDTDRTKVMLPLNPCAVSVRAGTGHVAVKDTDCIGIYAAGTHFVEQLTLDCPGVVSVSYSKDGRFLYASTATSVLKYAISASDYVLVTSVDTLDLVAVEGGKGHDVWVLKKTGLERWLGTSDGGYSPLTVSTLTKGKSLSYSSAKNAVVVLDDSRLRYFAVAANTVEIDTHGADIPGATAVVQTESAIRVLLAGGSRYFSVQPDGLVEIPALEDTQKGFALAAPNDKSQDFMIISRGAGAVGDLSYKAYAGSRYTDNPAREVASATREVGYRREAVLLSSVFEAEMPVNKVMAALNQTISSNTSVRLDISTDGGATWITDLALDEVCEVAEGTTLVYRLVLETVDPMDTPTVDSIELLQILTKALAPGLGGIAGGGSEVRLVP